MDKYTGLVSVVVITFNSSKYVVETLESIKSQTYQNIELVVSDDCSTDDTTTVCRNWIENNKNRFVSTSILTVKENTGVSSNLNRGVKATKGEWLKVLAGDDCLTENAIVTYVRFVNSNKSEICVAGMKYINDKGENIPTKISDFLTYYKEYLNEPHKSQLRRIYNELFIPGPPAFFSRRLFFDVNGFDERYPFADEWPFFFNVLKKGYHILAIDEELVKYRISDMSLSKKNGGMKDRRVYDSTRHFFLNEVRNEMIKKGMFLSAWHGTILHYIDSKCYNIRRKSFMFYCINLLLLASPKMYFIKFKSLTYKFWL